MGIMFHEALRNRIKAIEEGNRLVYTRPKSEEELIHLILDRVPKSADLSRCLRVVHNSAIHGRKVEDLDDELIECLYFTSEMADLLEMIERYQRR